MFTLFAFNFKSNLKRNCSLNIVSKKYLNNKENSATNLIKKVPLLKIKQVNTTQDKVDKNITINKDKNLNTKDKIEIKKENIGINLIKNKINNNINIISDINKASVQLKTTEIKINEKIEKIEINQKIENISNNDDYNLTESDLLYTNLIFQKEYQIFQDKSYIQLLIDKANSPELNQYYQELEEDWKTNKNKNIYNYTILVKYLEQKEKEFPEFMEWLDYKINLMDKKYSSKLINYIIDSCDLNTIGLTQLNQLSRFHMQELHQRKYKLLNHIEKYLLHNHMDIHPGDSMTFFSLLIESNWKKNDKNFCDFASRFILNNLAIFNYNQIALFLEKFSELDSTNLTAWKMIQEEVIYKFKTLYKAKTIERLTTCFTEVNKIFPDEFSNFFFLVTNYLSAIPMRKLQMGDFVAWCQLLKSDQVEESIKPNLIKELSSYVMFKEILNPHSDLLTFMNFYMLSYNYYQKHNQGILTKINNKISQEIVKSKNLSSMINNMLKVDYLKFFNFESLSNETFENLKNLSEIYFNKLKIVHSISKCDRRILNYTEQLIEFDLQNLEDCFFGAVNYLRVFNEEKDLEFYKIVKNYFIKFLFKNDLNDFNVFKMKILSLPLYTNLIFDDLLLKNKFKIEYIDPHLKDFKFDENENINEKLFIIMILYKYNFVDENNFIKLSDLKQLDKFELDLDNIDFETMRIIRVFSQLSLEEFNQLYENEKFNYEFYESEFDKLIYK